MSHKQSWSRNLRYLCGDLRSWLCLFQTPASFTMMDYIWCKLQRRWSNFCCDDWRRFLIVQYMIQDHLISHVHPGGKVLKRSRYNEVVGPQIKIELIVVLRSTNYMLWASVNKIFLLRFERKPPDCFTSFFLPWRFSTSNCHERALPSVVTKQQSTRGAISLFYMLYNDSWSKLLAPDGHRSSCLQAQPFQNANFRSTHIQIQALELTLVRVPGAIGQYPWVQPTPKNPMSETATVKLPTSENTSTTKVLVGLQQRQHQTAKFRTRQLDNSVSSTSTTTIYILKGITLVVKISNLIYFAALQSRSFID